MKGMDADGREKEEVVKDYFGAVKGAVDEALRGGRRIAAPRRRRAEIPPAEMERQI